MAPDLPYVPQDVPDDSEAPTAGGRFARLRRSEDLLTPPASQGLTEYLSAVFVASVHTARTTAAVAIATVLSLTLLAPQASADELVTQRARVEQQIAKTKSDLNESTTALSTAAVAVDRAQDKLDAANARLAETRQQLAVAKVKDAEMAAKLHQARADLAAAVAAVAAGQARLDAEQVKAGQLIRDQYQQQTNLLPIAVLVAPNSTEDLQTRLQWSTTLFDTTQAQIDRLTLLQRQLNAARVRQAELEAKVEAARVEAAANLKIKKALQSRAATDEATVAQLLRQRKVVEEAAASEVAQDKARYAELIKERASVERRIAARIAKATAERKRAERAAAERRRAAERKANTSRRSHSTSQQTHRPRPSAMSTAGNGFSFPVPARITSPFGMRFHPVLRYWKLHDGTDFGAACGTPIRAPRAGRVAERYYNVGYGKRLMIDHGYVNGRYVTTGYNHASRYIVGVGQRVGKGQIIGYVGSTGFSTGCHLHLMVWLNGRLRNPMTWF
ncbi:MAG TPA: peptidoglycan DD-metalloendopeptidase family protein [Propionibacteriaceae bacterium]|nr:peptidoglycan DD-metalloendopeptidase family protein [Propionibacteriaceae bacterium]